MYNPAFHTGSHNADITRDDHHRYPASTLGRGYIDVDTTGNYNLHLDPYMKHVYSEIPLSPMEAQHEPLEFHNLKEVEYITKQPGTYNNGNRTTYTPESHSYPMETTSSTTTATTTPCYPDITSTSLNTKTSNNVNSVTMSTDLDTYTMDKTSRCCTRQVTMHVVVMALAGLVYLGIGGITGYYIHKACKFCSYIYF